MATPEHAEIKHHATGYWWFVMLIMGGLSLTFNLWMVIDPPADVSADQAAINMGLGVIVHAAPVLLSALMSHGFNTPLLGEWERRIIIALFLLFMVMSISHQAALLEKAAHLHWAWAWSMPAAIDIIALLALRAILTAHRLNKAAAKAAGQAREIATVEARVRPLVEAEIRREMEASLPALRGDIEGDIWRDIFVRLGGDIGGDMSPLPGGDKGGDNRGDITTLLGGDIDTRMSLLREALRRDILAAEADAFEARRVERDEQIRREEREAALARWNAAEESLRSEISFQLRKEMAASTSAASRRAIGSGKAEKSNLTSEDKKRIIREVIEDGDKLTRSQLAGKLGVSVKTVDRIRKEVMAEMGLAAEPDVDDDAATRGRLRAV